MGSRRVDHGMENISGVPGSGPLGTSEPAGRHFKTAKKAPLWLRIAALTLTTALVLGVGTAGLLFFKLQSNVSTAKLNVGVGKTGASQGPAEQTGSLQILIIGTDTRDGANSEYGTAEDSTGEGNADVMLLMDISSDNSHVSVTSFPRDLMVPIPDCETPSGIVYGAPAGQLNATLQAGPGCTVAAINDITGLTIDHFMLADFTAVKELSTALGGVEVCIDHDLNDNPGSGLILPAGTSWISGEQALQFLRTRHSFGDASDLARIQAQQYFLGSMIRKIKSEGTLTNLPKLYTLADVVTKNLTIDEGLANIPSMVGIATRLAKIDLGQVAFVTVPNTQYVGNDSKVQLLEPDAGQFFAALRNGTSLTPEPAPAPTGTPTPGDTPSPEESTGEAAGPETTDPEAAPSAYDKGIQPISVANASTLAGRTTELIQALAADGFASTWPAGDLAAQTETKVLYGTNMADVAHDVAALFKLPDTALVEDPAITGVQLVVGTDWVSGTDYGTVVVPDNIVQSTADQTGQCLTVNPDMYLR
ncbi:LCP family protein required for cell wall assembly [Arthrobacter stackebrandtii]|uniref:LCP family protein required for cell wall assembly n=1 Tax=Arthrobacter stackebrandtii TaxID=272161 RepID=A0ABS4Z155_9MICC|nr:LCP family protein [Arthrobacter stackebrandtii]MBP2414447.1 LCP family protein required for cell wall assembly [Arthrobacter stackebrandtii]